MNFPKIQMNVQTTTAMFFCCCCGKCSLLCAIIYLSFWYFICCYIRNLCALFYLYWSVVNEKCAKYVRKSSQWSKTIPRIHIARVCLCIQTVRVNSIHTIIIYQTFGFSADIFMLEQHIVNPILWAVYAVCVCVRVCGSISFGILFSIQIIMYM